MDLIIRKYEYNDTLEICCLFYLCIHNIDNSIYTKMQKIAWCPKIPNIQDWSKRLSHNETYVAIQNDKIVGFIEFTYQGYIHCLYVHPDYQGNRIASILYQTAMIKLKRNQINSIDVYASKVAMPIFQKWGFVIVKENSIKRKGQVLVNFYMKKYLSNPIK